MTLPLGLNLLDVALLLVLALFMLRGVFRGLVDEVAGLVGIVAGVWLAGRFYSHAAAQLAPYVRDATWAAVAAYVLIVCAALVVVAMLAALLRKFFALTFTSWLNHLAGGAVGLIKGLVICAVMVGLLDYFLADAPFVRTSQVRPHIAKVSVVVMSALPLHLTR